jgi:diguanylate cyclase (GGDEF)-like protein
MISVDEKRIWTLAPDLLIDQGIVDRLVRMGKGLTDFTEDELAFPEKDLFLRHHLRFFAGFPLYEEGEVVAVLGSFFLNKEDFTPSIQELFFTLTNETGSALDSLKKEFLRHKSENKNILLKNIFQILAEINESITRIPDPENLYDLVCRSLSARGVLKVAMIGIFSQNGTLTVRKTSETSPKSLDEIFNLKDPGYLKEGQAIRDVFLTGKSQFLSYFSGESEGLPPKGEPGSAGIKAIGFYPIFRKETTPYGVFVSFSGDENFFDPDLQELFQRIAKTVTFGLENWDRELLRKNQEELNFHMSFYDALTDLPNRRLFYDRMEQICRESMRRDSIFGVGMLDLNGFKKINDTLGHLEGDHLLAEVARRMKEKIRSVDVLARLGGDEFGFVFSGLSSDCEVVMQRILDSFDEPFILGNKEVHVSGSLGVVLFHKTKLDPDEILSLADSTMYEVKKQGGGPSRSFRCRNTAIREEEP